MALCPNCGNAVSLDAVKCSRCGATFGPASAWKPLVAASGAEAGAREPSQGFRFLPFLLHMWCGFCVNVFANASGLVSLIASPPASADHRTASVYATLAGVLYLLLFGAGYMVSVYAVRWIDRNLRSPASKTTARAFLPVAYVVIAVALIALTSGAVKRQEPKRLSADPIVTKVDEQPAPVVAIITTQDPQGTSEADFDIAGLKRLESHLVQTTVEKARRNFSQRGFDPSTFNPVVDSSSVFMTVSGKRLGVVKMNMDNGVRSVWVMGFRGNQVVRVTCIRGSSHEIPLFSGECGSKVNEAFGVMLKPEPKQ